MSAAGGYRVPAVVGAVRALDALAALSGAGATLSEVARAIGRSKSTVFNLLRTLEDEGLVFRDPGTHRYHLGARLVPLGAAAAREARPLAMAMALARRIAFEEGVSVAVGQVVGGTAAQVVESATPPSGLHVGITIGDRFGIFDGAIGKSLLAGLPHDECERLVRDGTTRAASDGTVTDPDALLADVARVRQRGWAASVGELNEHNAVSAPIVGMLGEPVIILAAIGFASQLPEERIAPVGERLRAATASVSLETGGAAAGGGMSA
ncbi:MAG TPA: IclR family transcriptional regulator [Miltoncostaeaceae bacterium]|nr:IclR family transcriptional regulator [Miltoncostaeaceae bacterium]